MTEEEELEQTKLAAELYKFKVKANTYTCDDCGRKIIKKERVSYLELRQMMYIHFKGHLKQKRYED